MNKFFVVLFFLFLSLSALFSSPLPFNIEGDSVSIHKDRVVAKGKVKITFKDIVIQADEISFDIPRKNIQAKGNVFFKRGSDSFKAEEVVYNIKEKSGYVKGIKEGVSPPWFWKGEKIEKFTADEIILQKGEFTTCDRAYPHYHFVASKITIYTDDRIEAWNVVMYLGKLPVFYFPYYQLPIKDKPYGWVHWVGSSGRRGLSILSSYNWYVNPSLRGKLFIDWEENKGWGEGGDLEWKREREKGYFYAYNFTEKERYYEKFEQDEENARTGKEKLERWKVYSRFLKEWEGNTFAFKWEKLSDPNYNRDFYFEEKIRGWDTYPLRRDPETYFFLEKNLIPFTYGVRGVFQANYFEQKVEEKPSFYFSLPAYSISPFLYYLDVETSYLSSKPEKDSVRMLSRQKISLPLSRNNWEFVPSAVLRTDFYGKNREGDEAWRSAVSEELRISRRFTGKAGNSFITVLPYIVFFEQNRPYQDQDKLPYFDEQDRIKAKRSTKLGIDEIWERDGSSLDFSSELESIRRGDNLLNTRVKWKFNPRVSLSHYSKWNLSEKGDNFSSSVLSVKKGKINTDFGYNLYDDEDLKNTWVSIGYKPSELWNLHVGARYNINYSFLEEGKIELRRVLHCWEMQIIVKTEKEKGERPDIQFLVAFNIRAL
ncbi:MAG: LPS-assembly protein LptD [Caldiserica bacterium]|nr:LPS-assembly protein LptD [Caldisericota bacterium]